MTQALLHAGLVNAILGTLLAVVVALLAWLFRSRPAFVHGLWLLVLLKLLMPPLVHLPLIWPTTAATETSAAIAEQPAAPECPAATAAFAHPWVIDRGEFESQDVVVAPVEEELGPVAPAGDWWADIIAGIWLAGTLTCWATSGLRLVRLRRVLQELPTAGAEIQERIEMLAGRLGLRTKPCAFLVPAQMPPMLLVVGRIPRLLLPEALWGHLDQTQRDTLLLHELAHLRRGDHRLRWLELAVRGLYWWHPVAWWACRALRDAEEECCDAWVVWAAPDAGPAYAATLVETIAFLSGASNALPAGASGAGPVRLIKRRLTMILQGTTPRSLSRLGLFGVLLLGLGLLPLVPTLAHSDPIAARESNDGSALTAKRIVDEMKSCQACHQVVHAQGKNRAVVDKAHDEVVRLLDEVNQRRLQLRRAEDALKAALRRFEDQQTTKKPTLLTPPFTEPSTSDRRLKDVEKKLEKLLDEVEKLRKELRPAKSGASSTGRNNYMYMRTRAFDVPVSLNTGIANCTAVLFVSVDGGRSFRTVAKRNFPAEPDRKNSFSFRAPNDGVFGFLVATVDQNGVVTPPSVDGMEPMINVVVDTVAPKVVIMSEHTVASGIVKLSWEVTDDNLDVNTIRLEQRLGDNAEWVEVSKLRAAKGNCVLRPTAAAVTYRIRAADKAGNVGNATLQPALLGR